MPSQRSGNDGRGRYVRATLKPYKRPGASHWRVRGWVPVRQEDGTIARVRCERSAGSSQRSQAQKLADDLNAYYEKLVVDVRRPLTFARAVVNYLTAGGEARYLTDDLVREIGGRQCTEIDDTIMSELSRKLFPKAKPSTINRELHTPVVAVLRMAAKGRHCPPPALTRPRGHAKRALVDVPPESWYGAVLPHSSPRLRALILLLRLHGLRIGEALNRAPADLDLVRKVLLIPKTKTGRPAEIALSDAAFDAILAIPRWRDGPWIFGTIHRRNITRDLERACKLAGVPYFRPHVLGRHGFASYHLRAGKSLKWVADAGRWETLRIVSDTYGHLEKGAVDDEIKRAADDAASNWLKSSPRVVPIRRKT